MLPPGVYVHQMVRWLAGSRAGSEVMTNRTPERGDQPLVWCHIGDIGDINPLEDFIRQVIQTRPNLTFLITGPTDLVARDLPEDLCDVVIYHALPYESLKSARAFLDRWRPDLVMWMDQKFEVALLAEVHHRDIPAIWINARSPFVKQPKLAWLRGTARLIASGFDTILAENETSIAALSRLGVSTRKLNLVGALQQQTTPPSCNMAERDDLASILGARPIWLALSSSREEDALIVEAQRQVMRKSHRLLLVIVPDEPERVEDLAQELEREGWVVALRSADHDPTPEVQIYIADLPEEEGLWMHLSPITFIGQTLSGGPCPSPNAAASLGSVVLFGNALDQQKEAFERLEAAGAARRVNCKDHLAREVEYLLQPEHAAKMAMAAWDITTSGAELSGKIEQLVLDLLDRKGH